MRIVCDSFPWDIDIQVPPATDGAVSVRAVLNAIHGTLRKPLDREEWQGLGDASQKKVYQAMCTRFSKAPPSMEAHVLRIDYLVDRTMFLGLTPVGSAGEWSLALGSSRDLVRQ